MKSNLKRHLFRPCNIDILLLSIIKHTNKMFPILYIYIFFFIDNNSNSRTFPGKSKPRNIPKVGKNTLLICLKSKGHFQS